LHLYADNEGGNITIISRDGHHGFHMDANDNDKFRIYHVCDGEYGGFHYISDSGILSAGDVFTSNGVSLNSLYNRLQRTYVEPIIANDIITVLNNFTYIQDGILHVKLILEFTDTRHAAMALFRFDGYYPSYATQHFSLSSMTTGNQVEVVAGPTVPVDNWYCCLQDVIPGRYFINADTVLVQ
jgi:hypothetical protein